MTIGRYDHNWYENEMEQCENGDYVHYTDYAPLLARHNALVEMPEYKFDAERFCRVRARSARAMRNFDDEANFLRVADEIKTLKMAVDLHEQGAEHMRDEVKVLREEVTARAEVDRLIANESAADCKGEG